MKKKKLGTDSKLSLEKFRVAELRNLRIVSGGDGTRNTDGGNDTGDNDKQDTIGDNGGLNNPTITITKPVLGFN